MSLLDAGLMAITQTKRRASLVGGAMGSNEIAFLAGYWAFLGGLVTTPIGLGLWAFGVPVGKKVALGGALTAGVGAATVVATFGGH